MVKSVETTASSVYLQTAMTALIKTLWHQGQALRLNMAPPACACHRHELKRKADSLHDR